MPDAATSELPPRGSARGGGLSAFLYRHPRLRLGAAPRRAGRLARVAYLGSLAVLLVSAFWQLDPFTAEIVKERPSTTSGRSSRSAVYRTITLRTVAMAAHGHDHLRLARVPDRVLHGQDRLAAHAAPARRRDPDAALGELPRQGLLVADHPAGDGACSTGCSRPSGSTGPATRNVGTWLVFTYLWLPYMILPVYAGLERIPSSLLEASSDLGAARRALPQGHPAARLPGPRRGLDLHLLADARRLHHAAGRLEHAVHRQRHLRQHRRREQPAVRCGLRDGADRRDGRLPALARRAGAFENL